MEIIMIKVIKTKTKTITCGNCEALLEYEWTDIRDCAYRDISGVMCKDEYIKCPICNNKLTIREW